MSKIWREWFLDHSLFKLSGYVGAVLFFVFFFVRKSLGKKQQSVKTAFKTGSLMVQINSLFITDLKQLADLIRKMNEFDELGKGLKLVNSCPQK